MSHLRSHKPCIRSDIVKVETGSYIAEHGDSNETIKNICLFVRSSFLPCFMCMLSNVLAALLGDSPDFRCSFPPDGLSQDL